MDEYVSTGIPGVDTILGDHGIPRGHSVLVCGGPGSGKTTFATQFLYKGATDHGEAGVYITLDEEPDDIQEVPTGSLTLLVGPPEAGKSAFCHQVVLNRLAAESAVMFVTTEQTPDEITRTLMDKGLREAVAGSLDFAMLSVRP